MKRVAILIVSGALALAAGETKNEATPSPEEQKLKRNKTELKAYQEKVKRLSDKVMDDVQDTVKQLNQEALDTQ